MSELTVVPDIVSVASADLANLGSSLRTANAAAAPATTSMIAAAEDEVSAAIAALFGSHAQEFQALSAEAAAFHDEFVSALSGAANSYAGAEAANVTPLQQIENALNDSVYKPLIDFVGVEQVNVQSGLSDFTSAQPLEPINIVDSGFSTGALDSTLLNIELAVGSDWKIIEQLIAQQALHVAHL